jgi:enamine deaminase RidA (YjgF/YER057c/UK114 family)
VYLLRSYQLDIGSQWDYLVEKLKKRIPGHRPLWTALVVAQLALPAIPVELEVEAFKHEH